MDKREYYIDNPSCSAPFTVEVTKEEFGDYSVILRILGKIYTRVLPGRLDAIIIAKDIARALEDAFRHTYEDKSFENDNSSG